MRNKGLVELMVGLMVFLIFYIFFISTMVTNNTFYKRSVAESRILLDGLKLESFVRSFQDTLKLSLLQSVYNYSTDEKKVWQCYSKSFASDSKPITKKVYGNCIGDSQTSSLKDTNTNEINSACSWNGVLNSVLSYENDYNTRYLAAYKNYPANKAPTVNVPSSLSNGFVGVKIFSSANYKDSSWTFPSGNLELKDNTKTVPKDVIDLTSMNGPCGGSWNDCINSMKISPGCTVTLYEHIQNSNNGGKSIVLGSDQTDFSKVCTTENILSIPITTCWNNVASSLKVECDSISSRWNDAKFSLKEYPISMDRNFTPDARLDTVLKGMYDKAYELIVNDKIKQKLSTITQANDCNVGIINTKLNDLQSELSASQFDFKFPESDRSIFISSNGIPCQVSVKAKVDITEKAYTQYAVYNGNSFINDHVRLKFWVLSGTDSGAYNENPCNDYSISLNPSSTKGKLGDSKSTTVTLAKTFGSVNQVDLTYSGCPSGATCSLSQSSCSTWTNGQCSSTFTIATSSSTPSKKHSITITGTDEMGIVKSATFTLDMLPKVLVNAFSTDCGESISGGCPSGYEAAGRWHVSNSGNNDCNNARGNGLDNGQIKQGWMVLCRTSGERPEVDVYCDDTLDPSISGNTGACSDSLHYSCPSVSSSGTVMSGRWHTGPGSVDNRVEGYGKTNYPDSGSGLDSGWMSLCSPQNALSSLADYYVDWKINDAISNIVNKCQDGYVESGSWHVGDGGNNQNGVGAFGNNPINSGWMMLCVKD